MSTLPTTARAVRFDHYGTDPRVLSELAERAARGELEARHAHGKMVLVP